MPEIKEHEVYTTKEAQDLLKISSSTIKRLLKKSLITANKIGGQYRILGKEILRVLSPSAEREAVRTYQRVKRGVKRQIRQW